LLEQTIYRLPQMSQTINLVRLQEKKVVIRSKHSGGNIADSATGHDINNLSQR
jgi:hypothetical protein